NTRRPSSKTFTHLLICGRNRNSQRPTRSLTTHNHHATGSRRPRLPHRGERMPRKTQDPRLVALLDKRAKLTADFERHYARLKRAFNRLEKTRQALGRVYKRIIALEEIEP